MSSQRGYYNYYMAASLCLGCSPTDCSHLLLSCQSLPTEHCIYQAFFGVKHAMCADESQHRSSLLCCPSEDPTTHVLCIIIAHDGTAGITADAQQLCTSCWGTSVHSSCRPWLCLNAKLTQRSNNFSLSRKQGMLVQGDVQDGVQN